MTHHQDMGGLSAGSVPTNATEIFQEGLRLPPLKLRERGMLNETLVAILRQNVRIPDIFMGDLHAQVAACKIAAVRLREATSKFSDNTLLSAFSILLDRAEARGAGGSSESRRPRSDGSGTVARGAFDVESAGEIPDVPEFIPRR